MYKICSFLYIKKMPGTATLGRQSRSMVVPFIVPSVSLILIIEAYITFVDDNSFPLPPCSFFFNRSLRIYHIS